jgi:thimet oligopeptidase
MHSCDNAGGRFSIHRMTNASNGAEELGERNQRRLATGEALLSRLEQMKPPIDQNRLLESLNTLLLELENVVGDANLFSQVHPDAAMRQTADGLLRQAAQLRTRLMHSRWIYEALGALDQSSVDPLAWRAAMLTRQDMLRAGVALSDEQRTTARALREDLAQLEQEFARNIRNDVRQIQLMGPEELDGLPTDYVLAHPPGADGQIHIATTYPDYYPFMNYANSERARMALLQEFYNRAVPSNLDVLSNMLDKRYQLANLLGYSSWADYVTEDNMAGSAREVASFLEHVEDAVRMKVQAELSELLAFKQRRHPSARTIGLWESLYYQQCVRTERFAFDARALRPYFEYRSVKQAILDLNSELFGFTFSAVAENPGWHPSVETFDVELDGTLIGWISLDMHPRPGKYTHAACFHWRKGVASQLPHVVLVCNFPDPAAQSDPALLEHQEVVTFFHEFGHLVHAMARGKTAWVRLADPTERDFIEAPSQLMEEWAFNANVLRRFARHAETGELIPPQLVDQLIWAREFGRALFTQWLLFRSEISLALHDHKTKRNRNDGAGV